MVLLPKHIGLDSEDFPDESKKVFFFLKVPVVYDSAPKYAQYVSAILCKLLCFHLFGALLF